VSGLLRVYLDPAEIGHDGYPHAWGRRTSLGDRIPNVVRELAGHRCVRCGHPYRNGEHGNGEWSSCDLQCTHGGPVRVWSEFGTAAPPSQVLTDCDVQGELDGGFEVDAQWRILTVHHLNGVKHDCRWWNLAALCQRCHLSIQGRVLMERVYPLEHSDWFKPYAAGWYAWAYLGEELTREQTLARLDELLALERAA
jgi:hypothetical protein